MPTRRSFLAASSATALSLLAARKNVYGARADHDLILRGGTVFDGTGAPGRDLDVGITGGRIAEIAPTIAGRGREEIEVRGLVVAPGFVDLHSHADSALFEDPRAESVIRQGITTIVGGADGSSRALGSPARPFAAYFDSIDRLQPACNVASNVGLGSVRGAVVGNDDRPATAAELESMRGFVERALRDGACGVSSGLEYTPGAFASLDELIALCKPLSARGLVYATHMRNEDDRLLDAIEESIAVAKGAGCGLQISHLKTQGPRNWKSLDTVFARIEAERAAGLDVAFDRYPYLAYATGLTSLFPVWSRDGGTEAFFRRLDDATEGARVRAETLAKIELLGGWDNVQITSVRAVEDRDAEGARMGAYAQRSGTDPYERTVQLLRRSEGNVSMIGFAMSEANLERILAHPLGMVCTDGGGFAIDGPTRRGSPHPRGIGSFPHVLGRYVRERGALTMAAAIHKMTALPASRVRLSDRGRIAVGLWADVTVFDAASVADKATFEAPFAYPEGVRVVLVNGAVALRNGSRSAVGTGRALRLGMS